MVTDILGYVVMRYEGEYDSKKLYKSPMVVTLDGQTYCCYKDCTDANTPVTDTAHWFAVAKKGANGANGANGNDGVTSWSAMTDAEKEDILGKIQTNLLGFYNSDIKGFIVTDSGGNICMKYDANGLDAAALSTHLQTLIKSIDGIASASTLSALIAANRSAHTEIFALISALQTLISSVEETGMNVTDANGNVGMRYDANGLDVAALSSHLQLLIKEIDGIASATTLSTLITSNSSAHTEIFALISALQALVGGVGETGMNVIDTNGNVGMKYDANGLDAALISTHFIDMIKSTMKTSDTRIQETDESGFYISDANGYVSLSISAAGVTDIASISDHAKGIINSMSYDTVIAIDN